MTTATILEEVLHGVPAELRAAFRADYRTLTQLRKRELNLQQFLDEYLRSLVQLFAATGGAIWFRGPESSRLTAKSLIGFDRQGITGDLEPPHDDLLQYAMSKRKSLLVRPFSSPAKQAGVSNPTDSFVVLGPVDHHDERIAVVELFLGPAPLRGKTAAERNRYLLWLDHLISYLCQGIELRLLRKSAPLQPALEQLQKAATEVEQIQSTLRATIERHLAEFAGWNFGALEDNQAFASRVHEMLDRLGLRIVCPQCGAAAILRCQNAGNAKTGVFHFDHKLESGRTFHGGRTTFPRVQLTTKPPRQK